MTADLFTHLFDSFVAGFMRDFSCILLPEWWKVCANMTGMVRAFFEMGISVNSSRCQVKQKVAIRQIFRLFITGVAVGEKIGTMDC